MYNINNGRRQQLSYSKTTHKKQLTFTDVKPASHGQQQSEGRVVQPPKRRQPQLSRRLCKCKLFAAAVSPSPTRAQAPPAVQLPHLQRAETTKLQHYPGLQPPGSRGSRLTEGHHVWHIVQPGDPAAGRS